MPLYDYDCAACGRITEHYVPCQQLDTPRLCDCGEPLTRLPFSAGVTRKTGVFPFTSTHLDGKGTPIVVESLGHLRSLEAKYGVLATGFSQDSVDSPKDLPTFRPEGRKWEGKTLQQEASERRAESFQRAIRALETGKYRRRALVTTRG